MGIYIKGMEMPEFGEKIIILTSSGYIEDVSGQVIDGVEAVSVSAHGRMIDADALEKDVDKYIGGEESRSRFHHWVQVQRTVIPESEEART